MLWVHQTRKHWVNNKNMNTTQGLKGKTDPRSAPAALACNTHCTAKSVSSKHGSVLVSCYLGLLSAHAEPVDCHSHSMSMCYCHQVAFLKYDPPPVCLMGSEVGGHTVCVQLNRETCLIESCYSSVTLCRASAGRGGDPVHCCCLPVMWPAAQTVTTLFLNSQTYTVEVRSLYTLRLKSLKLIFQPVHKILVSKLQIWQVGQDINFVHDTSNFSNNCLQTDYFTYNSLYHNSSGSEVYIH